MNQLKFFEIFFPFLNKFKIKFRKLVRYPEFGTRVALGWSKGGYRVVLGVALGLEKLVALGWLGWHLGLQRAVALGRLGWHLGLQGAKILWRYLGNTRVGTKLAIC
jgi:hypothetical protein